MAHPVLCQLLAPGAFLRLKRRAIAVTISTKKAYAFKVVFGQSIRTAALWGGLKFVNLWSKDSSIQGIQAFTHDFIEFESECCAFCNYSHAMLESNLGPPSPTESLRSCIQRRV